MNLPPSAPAFPSLELSSISESEPEEESESESESESEDESEEESESEEDEAAAFLVSAFSTGFFLFFNSGSFLSSKLEREGNEESLDCD